MCIVLKIVGGLGKLRFRVDYVWCSSIGVIGGY